MLKVYATFRERPVMLVGRWSNVGRTLIDIQTDLGDSGGRTTSNKATCNEQVAVHLVVHRHFTLQR